MADQSRLKKSLLDIPPEGATVSTLAKIWKVSAKVASTLLSRHRRDLVYRCHGPNGLRYWKLRTQGGGGKDESS